MFGTPSAAIIRTACEGVNGTNLKMWTPGTVRAPVYSTNRDGGRGESVRIGAHVKSSGSPRLVFDRALGMGAEAIQMFISAPQQWKPPAWTDEDVEAFRSAHAEHPDIPVFMHGVYLVNLATDDPVLLNRSAGSLKQYLKWGASLGVTGTISTSEATRARGLRRGSSRYAALCSKCWSTRTTTRC